MSEQKAKEKFLEIKDMFPGYELQSVEYLADTDAYYTTWKESDKTKNKRLAKNAMIVLAAACIVFPDTTIKLIEITVNKSLLLKSKGKEMIKKLFKK